MSGLSRAALEARTGAPLDEVAPAAATARSVTLTVTQRHDLIDLWTTLLTDVYPHYLQKRALYGFDPIRALAALRREIPYLDSAGFLRELTSLINRLRDQHTQMFVGDAGDQASSYVASLPFLVEGFGSYLSPTFVVTKTTDDIADPGFVAGARLTTWNGVPFARAVDLYADTLTGGRPDARRARALETLTQRPLAYLPPPEELWVDVGYRHPDDDPAVADRTTRFEWRAIRPSTASSADNLLESRTRRAINVTSETARRARKLLFATESWEADQRDSRPRGDQTGWVPTNFSDAISTRNVTTPHGTFGYLRIWTFDVEHTSRFIDATTDLLRELPATGLIIDLRSNPGGVIDVAERMLQLFTDRTIEPARFACRATPAMVDITGADGNGADLADWAGSTRAAIDLGEEFSQHLPITDPESCNDVGRVYTGPVIAIVDANTYSCGDLFAAGIVDHGIGGIVSIGAATGAGGANVWTSDEVQYAYHAARRDLPPLPPGIGFTISVRRMVRSGDSAGLAIEDVGVLGEDEYDMTERDLVEENNDLIDYCARLLASA
jgi:hypothetical protein